MPRPVKVISASVRPTRIGPRVARWVMAAAPTALDLDLVDLADWPLPMDAEPGIPARDGYVHELTRAWSRAIDMASAFVFVTPQYNWGYPAPLKNALDQLYREWNGKPAMIVSYGFHGGGKCAAQLHQVLDGLRMRPVATMPTLTLPKAMRTGEAGIDVALAGFAPELALVQKAFGELAASLKVAP